jgi:hypothetical protein
MDPVRALRRCVKRPGPLEFAWWPGVREVAVELYTGLVARCEFRHDTAYRSLQLFERLAALHGKEQLDAAAESKISLDMTVAFVIAQKLEETECADIRTFAGGASVDVLREAEKLALDELEWGVYSPTARQFLDVLVDPGQDRERAAKLIDRFALHKSLSLLSSEELARAALDATRGVHGAHADVWKSATEPRTVVRKRRRSSV